MSLSKSWRPTVIIMILRERRRTRTTGKGLNYESSQASLLQIFLEQITNDHFEYC